MTIEEQKEILKEYYYKKKLFNDESKCYVDDIFEYDVIDNEDIVLLGVNFSKLSTNIIEVPEVFDCADNVLFFSEKNILKELNINSIKKIIRPCTLSGDIENLYAENLECITNNFASFSGLKFVMANKAINVKRGAFYYCIHLEEIIMNNLEKIEFSAFSHCESLEKLDLRSVKIIENTAFSHCLNLKSVDLCDLEEISLTSFSDCAKDLILCFHKRKDLSNLKVVDGTLEGFLLKYKVEFRSI